MHINFGSQLSLPRTTLLELSLEEGYVKLSAGYEFLRIKSNDIFLPWNYIFDFRKAENLLKS
jgi:hypothetical protein